MGMMMRYIKLFFVGFAGLFIVITIFSLVIPQRIKVSRVVVISGHSKTEILDQVNNLQNWKNWQPLFKSDSANIQYSDKKLHCMIRQNGNETFLDIDSIDSSAVKFTLKEKGERKSENEIVINPLPIPNSLQVEWKATTKLKWYPWEKFYGIFIDKLTGPGYENSLNGLKEYIETKQTTIVQ
jgi:hypothetical protein